MPRTHPEGEALQMTSRVLRSGAFALAFATAAALFVSGPASAQKVAGCLDPSASLSVEENRLSSTLPDNDDPSIPQARTFAQQMIDGGGFQDFAPTLTHDLCRTPSLNAARALVRTK